MAFWIIIGCTLYVSIGVIGIIFQHPNVPDAVATWNCILWPIPLSRFLWRSLREWYNFTKENS